MQIERALLTIAARSFGVPPDDKLRWMGRDQYAMPSSF
jgi:hypothetical protein